MLGGLIFFVLFSMGKKLKCNGFGQGDFEVSRSGVRGEPLYI